MYVYRLFPFHCEMSISRMYWKQAKCMLNIDLCKKGIRPTLKDFGYSIINIVKFGIGEINNQSSFTLLMTFGNYLKSANVGIRAGDLVIGVCYSMIKHLSCKVIFNYLWVKESAFRAFVCTLQ